MACDEYGLTLKQRLFCMHYQANGGNGKQAAIAAGYTTHASCEAASETLRHPNVKKYLGNKMKEAAEKLGISPERILNALITNVDDCKNGRATKEGYVNASGVVSSINEINKILGYHAPEKRETEVTSSDIKKLIEQEKKDH